ncbi:MAG: alpha/beta fold hydrolase [Polyangiales bacterium]
MSDPILDEVVLFVLGQTWTQAADVSEVLETARRIDGSDPESWAREWQKTAERLFAVGEASDADGHRFSASHAYLRAATYYRAALMRHMHPYSPEVAALTTREVEAFQRSLALGDSSCKPVEIPYEQSSLPGFFCPAAHGDGPAPVIIFNVGRDVWAEDAKIIADEANKRGYHALLFDGPGQGKTLRLRGLPFRHDWEKVITPVVDFALAQRCVDAERIALWGESMGGYLVPRAAAFEHRLALIIANPGVLDWYRVFEANLTGFFPDALDLLGKDEAAFNAAIEKIMAESPFGRWGLEDTMWKHGVGTPAELVHELEHYSLNGRETQITARALVVDAEKEDRGQARELYDALQTSKDYLLFTASEAAQFHDQPGARAISTQRIFDWIDDAW